MTTQDNFITLFRGRGDCYGSWAGGCVRQLLTRDKFHHHLYDDTPIGVYPAFNVEGITMTAWGCTDIDKTDDPTDALRIQQALAAVNVTSWIERTAHGWHVWVFTEGIVEARNMRRMFLAAHKLTDIPAKEVNPKQEQLTPTDVGNYVRLPYPNIVRRDGRYEQRYMCRNLHRWDSGFTTDQIDLDEFVNEAVEARTQPDLIRKLATYYTPPETPRRQIAAPTQDMTEAARQLSPIGRAIFRDGPLPTRDRSTTLLRLVHECHEAGLAPEDCWLLLEDADLRWGKFVARGPKGENELAKMISKVYGHTP